MSIPFLRDEKPNRLSRAARLASNRKRKTASCAARPNSKRAALSAPVPTQVIPVTMLGVKTTSEAPEARPQ